MVVRDKPGISLSIFLGFRNNACYDRWWKARKLWGQLIHELRSLARVGNTLLAAEPETARRLVRRAVAFPTRSPLGCAAGGTSTSDGPTAGMDESG